MVQTGGHRPKGARRDKKRKRRTFDKKEVGKEKSAGKIAGGIEEGEKKKKKSPRVQGLVRNRKGGWEGESIKVEGRQGKNGGQGGGIKKTRGSARANPQARREMNTKMEKGTQVNLAEKKI